MCVFTLHVWVLNGVYGGYRMGSMVEMMGCYDSVRWIASMLFVDINIFTWSRFARSKDMWPRDLLLAIKHVCERSGSYFTQ